MQYSEFEIQAEAYYQLRTKLENVRGEYQLPRRMGYGSGRADIVILDQNKEKILLIIEVKKSNKKNEYQHALYGNLVDCPIIYIHGMAEARDAFEIVQDVLAGMHVLTLKDFRDTRKELFCKTLHPENIFQRFTDNFKTPFMRAIEILKNEKESTTP